MATNSLTASQRELLQRWFDGELEGDETARAETLVESSEAARLYIEGLEEVRRATVAAFETSVDNIPEPRSSKRLTDVATDAPQLDALTLEELAPVLERYHDEEVTAAEHRRIDELRADREDVDAYLNNLETLGNAVRAADRTSTDQVDLDGIWEGVERGIEFDQTPDQPPSYDPERDQPLLHRYVDGELPDSKRRLVEAWLDEDGPEPNETVEAIEQLGEATRAANAEVTQEVEFEDLWDGVQQKLEDDDANDADIVSLDNSRTDGGEASNVETGTSNASSAANDDTVEWLSDYRQALVGAAAAALILIATGVSFGPTLFNSERVVVKEKKVVIVDSVQYSNGSSVVVDSPMQEVSSTSGREDETADKEDDEEKPTVIWLLDSEKNDDGGPDDSSGSPADAPEETDDAGSSDDAGSTDETPPKGQPI